jgi:hypothetical protein
MKKPDSSWLVPVILSYSMSVDDKTDTDMTDTAASAIVDAG